MCWAIASPSSTGRPDRDLASERDRVVRESAGECGEHLQQLPAFDSALPELSLHVANLIDLSAPCVYGQLRLEFPNMLVKQVDLAMQPLAARARESAAMTRARDPQQPLPRDPRTPRRREFLYPYEVLAEDGASLTLADATLEEFAGIYQWNLSDDPQTGVVNAVQTQCWREHQSAMRHLVRLLAIGTLGVAPRQVGDAIAWHQGYVAMHDGGPEPEADLSDFFAFWTGNEADDLGGVCAESGLLCWWEAKLGPGWVRETGYFLQELRDFTDDGPTERVERIWIDRDVESELRPLVAKMLGSG